MIETYLHFAVKIAVCGYVLYKVWTLLFKDKLFGIWNKLPVKKKIIPKPVAEIKPIQETETDIIGKTTIIYLEDPELAAKVPVRSEKLEPSDFIGEDPDIPDDEVESNLSSGPKSPEEVLEEQERFEVLDDISPGLDSDFSTGLTYEELSNAVGVLTVQADNEQQIIDAAKTIHQIKDTDLFEFFTNQVSNLDNVESLMKDCLDDDGAPLKIRKSKKKQENLSSFELDKYV